MLLDAICYTACGTSCCRVRQIRSASPRLQGTVRLIQSRSFFIFARQCLLLCLLQAFLEYLNYSILQDSRYSIITTAMSQEQSVGSPKPDEKTLREAGELEVLDESGKALTFNQLYNTEGRRVIVFIRHFFCGVSC